MSKTKYEVIDVNGVEFTVDVSMLIKTDDMFFNATEIAKQFNKKPVDFLKTDSTNEYIKAVIEDSRSEDIHLEEEDLIRVKRGGRYQGTWLNKKLALQFSRWLSPMFSVKFDKWVIKRLKEEDQRRKDRLEAKTGYLDLSIAVDNDHDPVKHYHFSNEANLINRIVLGMDAKKYKEFHSVENIRDNLDTFQISAIKELQLIDTALIKTDVEYQARKEQLTRYYKEKILLPL